jgi:zinc protease
LTENERAKKYGFTEGEFDRAKQEIMTRMERAFKERDKTESGRYVQGMVASFLEGEPLTDMAYRMDFYKKYMGSIKLDEVNGLAKKWISDKGDNATVIIQMTKKEGLKPPTEDELRKVFEEVAAAKIDPPKEEVVATSIMENKPTAGKIVSEIKNESLGTTELMLSNGVKVVVKPTTFKNDEIMLSAYSPGGYAKYPIADDDNGGMASFAIGQAGIGELDAVALQRFMTGKTVRIFPYISEIFEGFNGQFSPKDAETAMQMVHLYFTNPRKDPKMFKTLIDQQKVFIQNSGKSPEQQFRDSVMIAMYGNNPRRQPMKAADLDKVSLDRCYDIFRDRFADAGDFTFFFVGNVEDKAFRPLVETYLASLPSKGRKETWVDPNVLPVSKIEKNVQSGREPKATVQLTYVGKYDYSRKENLEMMALVKLLDIKLREKIREEKGGSYGVSVQPNITKYPQPRYSLTVQFGCAPEKVGELMTAALGEVEAVLKNGSEDKNMVKIKETFLRERETDLKENRFWMSYLSQSYQNGMDVNDWQKYNDWVKGLSSKDLKKMAKKYIKNGNLLRFTLKPDTKA